MAPYPETQGKYTLDSICTIKLKKKIKKKKSKKLRWEEKSRWIWYELMGRAGDL